MIRIFYIGDVFYIFCIFYFEVIFGFKDYDVFSLLKVRLFFRIIYLKCYVSSRCN